MELNLPPAWVVQGSVAAVWLYEGLWCKLLGREPRQLEIIGSAPWGRRAGAFLLPSLGALETALAFWVLSGAAPAACALTQTVLLASLNAGGLLWGRTLIADPAGMVVKNLAFLVLAWVGAGLGGRA